MQTSRQRRRELSRGIVEKPVEKLKNDAEFKKVIDESIEVVEKAKDIVEKALKDTKKKKTTRKKKTTKKADEECKEK